MKNYKVIKDGDRFTIGEWSESYKAYIINDGICQYYWWNSELEAQTAADAYNAYNGTEWLGQHGYGNDIINEDEIDENDLDSEVVNLYRVFNAVR